MWKIFYIKKVDKICIKEIKNNIRKKDRDEAGGGTLCALGSKRVTAASRMSEEHIFYKNA